MSGYNLKLSATPIHQSSEVRPQHIYITNDEEIKEGDYMYDIDGDVGKAIGSDMKEFEGNKKIILTTDEQLISDGVQSIDDEFLEWFVKNPSCEEVKVRKNPKVHFIVKGKGVKGFNQGYKIIIPKEEPKDVVLGYKTSLDAQMLDKIEPKQETLEEAAEKYVRYEYPMGVEKAYVINDFISGAKWQQERMYSEEEVKDLIEDWTKMADGLNMNFPSNKFNIWFEQFKKK
jgi:uncharacterized protein YneR